VGIIFLLFPLFKSAPGMGGNSVVKVHYGGWQTPTISLRQGCLP